MIFDCIFSEKYFIPLNPLGKLRNRTNNHLLTLRSRTWSLFTSRILLIKISKLLVKKAYCLKETYYLLKIRFCAEFDVVIEPRPLNLRSVWLQNSERIVAYYKRILKLDNEMENADHCDSEIARKKTLFRDLTEDFEVIGEAKMNWSYSYQRSFPSLQ